MFAGFLCVFVVSLLQPVVFRQKLKMKSELAERIGPARFNGHIVRARFKDRASRDWSTFVVEELPDGFRTIRKI